MTMLQFRQINLIVYNICSSFSKQYAKYDFSKK